jgi:hypothetical protein
MKSETTLIEEGAISRLIASRIERFIGKINDKDALEDKFSPREYHIYKTGQLFELEIILESHLDNGAYTESEWCQIDDRFDVARRLVKQLPQ